MVEPLIAVPPELEFGNFALRKVGRSALIKLNDTG
jgi:hypothetical protein